MNNIVRFFKVGTIAMAVTLCSFVSSDLYSMNKADTFPIQFNYVIPQTKKINTVSAEVTYAGTYVNGDDLYVAAQSYAPGNFTVTRIEDNFGNKIEDDNTHAFFPDWGDGEYLFIVYGK